MTALPERFETPAYFSEGELNVLRGTNLFFAWHDRINLWKEEFEKVRNIIPDINWYPSWKVLEVNVTGMIIYGPQQFFHHDPSPRV